MDRSWWKARRLIVAALVAGFAGAAGAGTMPNVQPISVDPVGVAPGGGIQARYTYEIRLPLAAANDAGATAAANEASYATRLVTIGRATSGGIIDGAVAVGSKLAWWATAAYLAYQAYKWYRDSQTNALMSPGQTVPPVDCAGGMYWQGGYTSGELACTLPGVQRLILADLNAYWGPHGGSYTSAGCSWNGSPSSGADCAFNFTYNGHTNVEHYGANPLQNAPAGTQDAGYSTDPTPVPMSDVGQIAEQHPDWWPSMLTDPSNGAPLITPEVAQDMDALKQQLAPQYGVDPTTLTPTQPDSQYQQGVADQRQPTALPQYCAWATAACSFYQYVEDNWPDSGKKQYTASADCDTPPTCSGDEVLCGIASEQWRTRCAFTGSGDPPDAGHHVVQELYTDDKDLGDTSQLDTTGFGLSDACPFTSISIDFAGQTGSVSLDFLCQYGVGLRYLILLWAAWSCAKIMGNVQTNT